MRFHIIFSFQFYQSCLCRLQAFLIVRAIAADANFVTDFVHFKSQWFVLIFEKVIRIVGFDVVSYILYICLMFRESQGCSVSCLQQWKWIICPKVCTDHISCSIIFEYNPEYLKSKLQKWSIQKRNTILSRHFTNNDFHSMFFEILFFTLSRILTKKMFFKFLFQDVQTPFLFNKQQSVYVFVHPAQIIPHQLILTS